MHHKYTRPLLALLVLVLASLACGTNVEETITRGNVVCKVTKAPEDYLDYVSLEYLCTCESGGTIGYYRRAQLARMSDEELGRSCGPMFPSSSSSAAATATPTEEPTAPPTEPPTDPAPLNPYLTGTFTACDNAARYVNFSIAENAPAYDPATFKLLFNGEEANCAPAPNNPSILTCNYPPVSYNPPAGIQVFIGEELVNEFDFNGGPICDPAPVPPSNDNNDDVEPPAPTEPPVPTEPPLTDG